MQACQKCHQSVPEGSAFCPACGASLQRAENPYQATEAVIDARPIVPQSVDNEQATYNLPFGVGATIGEMFNIVINSLGELLLIALIPFVPVLVMSIVAIAVIVTAVIRKFPAMLENFEFDQLMNLIGGLGVGVAVMFVVFVLLMGIFTFPSFMGQFIIIDEKIRYGELRTGVWRSYLSGFRFILPVFGLVILAYLGMVLLILPAFLFAKIPVLAVLYVIAILIVLSFLMMRFCITFPLMVIEGLPLFSALGRSNQMIIGRTWTVMGIYGVFFAVMIGITFGVGIVGMIPVIGQLVGLAAQFLMAPLQVAIMFAIYAGIKSQNDL